ncbi:ADP-ribose pyrophosphatase [Frankia canadensis]|uniref:ADP-ribose pyrophosphatase n=1 Tax=Frankia canadensis TaxID=1836972 RepID=A0A2I2KTB5_9ACTN|nr:NUDIX hydrolase [Frankia canadensis]SNQ48900.1 ADP-ribose pyrophosphatase [Frankia canadensis]SOU56190.1 ADP-ribose pyrophosphatase [Frankia canadensis]
MTAAGHRYEVTESTLGYQGRIIAVRRDLVRMPDGDVSQRDVVVHPGAVGVVALDDAGQVVLVHQYRHPVGGPLWELPAGILDVPGEPASVAAARELAEEAALRAGRYDLLVDVWSSPGMTNEAYRVFLARDLSEIPAAERYVPEHEEAEMSVARFDLDEAVARVLRGEITNAMAVVGLLAAARARADDFAGLRPLDAPWPGRPAHNG